MKCTAMSPTGGAESDGVRRGGRAALYAINHEHSLLFPRPRIQQQVALTLISLLKDHVLLVFMYFQLLLVVS